MSLLHEPTAAESRRTFRESLMLEGAEAIHHAASIRKQAHIKFWGVDPVQLVADLNSDLEKGLILMENNRLQSERDNASLELFADVKNPDGSQRFPNRAPTEIGNPRITFDAQTASNIVDGIETGNPDGTNLFIYTEPPEPEEEP